MKWFALAILIIMIGLVLYLVWFIGSMPGRVAAERNHPKAEAINVGSWAALVFGAVGWPWVLMWAYSHPAPEASIKPESAEEADGDTP